MAKEVAVSKRIKITKAQQNMLLAVLLAAIVFGAALSVSINLIKRIAFNKDVIVAKDQAISSYSDVIENVGICRKPAGSVYTEDELRRCNPDSIELSQIPGTLRANILQVLAADQALNSVIKEDDNSCINSATNKNFTYEELQENYKNASTDEELAVASDMIKTCSALRMIPDALPSFRNEEALLSSLNKIFDISGWQPEALMPGDSAYSTVDADVLPIGVNLSIEADTTTTMNVLNNIERSIREFDINNASVEWAEGYLNLSARATAYYVEPTFVVETNKTIKAGDKK